MACQTSEEIMACIEELGGYATAAAPALGTRCNFGDIAAGIAREASRVGNSLQFLQLTRAEEQCFLIECVDTADAVKGIGVGDLLLAKDQKVTYFEGKAEEADPKDLCAWWKRIRGLETCMDEQGNFDTSQFCFLVWGVVIAPTNVYQQGNAPLTEDIPIYVTNFLSPDAPQIRQFQAKVMRSTLFTINYGNNKVEATLGIPTENGGSFASFDVGGGEGSNRGDRLVLQFTPVNDMFLVPGSSLVNSQWKFKIVAVTQHADVVWEADVANPCSTESDPDRGPIRVSIRVELVGTIVCCPQTELCKPKRSRAPAEGASDGRG